MYFIIEDGYNTSYISALFVGLFYEKTNIERIFLLDKLQSDNHFIYLQKLIKHKFVENIRNNISVPASIVNEIRNYAYLCGWKSELPIDHFMEEHDVVSFLEFLLSTFKIQCVELSDEQKMIIPIDQINCHNLTEIYNKWMLTHTITNLPSFITFKIDRNILKKSQIDIMCKIRLFNSDHIYNNIKWIFHCVICKNPTDNYYCVLSINQKLYVWSDKSCPNLLPFNKYDQNNISKIKMESVCVIYRKQLIQ